MQTSPIRYVAGAAVLWLSTACNPSAPTPVVPPTVTPPPPPPVSVTVSGVAYEVAESGPPRPVPQLRMRVLAATPFGGAVGGTPLADVETDATGRYTVTNSPSGVLYFQVAPSQAHRFLCDWFGVWDKLFTDLPVVPHSWTGTRPPAGMWLSGASVHGVVSESVNGITQPLAGAQVTLETGSHDPDATTEPNGFYMICSMTGADQNRWITASKPGYQDHRVDFFPGWVTVVNFTLFRN